MRQLQAIICFLLFMVVAINTGISHSLKPGAQIPADVFATVMMFGFVSIGALAVMSTIYE